MNPRVLHVIIALTAALAAAAQRYASSSVMAEGRWVKVETSTEGIYQLTYDRLQAMGFDRPEMVQVYGVGATGLPSINHSNQPYADDMPPTATLHVDDKLLFFATGTRSICSSRTTGDDRYISVVSNPYDTHSYYFISDSRPPAELPSGMSATGTGEAVTSHVHIDWVEDDLYNPAEGGSGLLGKEYKGGEAATYTFDIKDYSPSGNIGKGSFFYSFAIGSDSRVSLSVELPEGVKATSTVDNASPARASDTYYTYATGTSTFSPEGLSDGEYAFSVAIPPGSYSYCAAERAVLRYPRANKVDENAPSIVMNLPSGHTGRGTRVAFPGHAASGLRMWNIDNLDEIYAIEPVDVGADREFVLSRACQRAVAFDPAYDFPSPTECGSPSIGNLHAAATPDMLIVTTAPLMHEAERLADLHRRHQGLDVLVADHLMLYDEFSHGSRHPMAFRRIAKMFYDRDPARFRYLLFLGPGHYDNSGVFTGASPAERLVVYEQDQPSLWNSWLTNYCADTYFSMLDDRYNHSEMHFTKSDISVGRIPAADATMAAAYIDKVEARLRDKLPPEVFRHVLLTAGSGNSGIHAAHQQEVGALMREANPGLRIDSEFYHQYPDADSRAAIPDRVADRLTEGLGYFTYSGHGSDVAVESWSSFRAGSTSYDYPPFVMFSSCDQFCFDRMRGSLMENMLFAPGGGALAGVAAARSVIIAANQLACARVAHAYAGAVASDCCGDIFTKARNAALASLGNDSGSLQASQSTFRNLLAFNFAGDPAIPVGAPAHDIYVTRINALEVDGTDPVGVLPVEPTVIEGIVKDPSGDIATDYDGKVLVQVMDGERMVGIVNVDNEPSFPELQFPQSQIVAEIAGDVKDGHFSIECRMPVPNGAAATNRLLFSAMSDSGVPGAGIFSRLVINGDSIPEYSGEMLSPPAIIALGVSDLEFPSATDNASATIYAHVDPSPSGIVLDSPVIGSVTRIMVDRREVIESLGEFVTDHDGTLEFRVPVANLAQGSHTVEFTAVSNAGITARQTIGFEAERKVPDLTLTADSKVGREAMTFSLYGADGATLVINDSMGHTVFRKEDARFPFTWDLLDRENRPLPPGPYRATALSRDRGYDNHASLDFVIIPE